MSGPRASATLATMQFHLAAPRRPGAALLAILVTAVVAAGHFQTADPLRAFVRAEYPLGSDYFINGTSCLESCRSSE